MPCLNEEASVDTTFSSLFAGSRLPDEVIVADGGSRDATLEKISRWVERGYPITVVRNDKVFPGAGRNAAAKASRADIFVSVDFGNSFDSGYMECMVKPLEEDDEVDVVAGTFIPDPRSPLERVIAVIDYHQGYCAAKLPPQKRRALVPAGHRHTPGGSVAWRRSVWEAAGGQPDWLRAAEDLLFGYRVLRFDPRFAFGIEADTYHHMRPDLASYFSMRKTYARGRCRAGLMTPPILRGPLLFTGVVVLLCSSALIPWLLPPAVLMAAWWLWRQVVRPIRRADNAWPSLPDFLRGIAVVTARETAMVHGIALGTLDWLGDPEWKARRREYLANGTLPS
jgi:cellulose synthase/poly-beta-1,6-N-acetylglucosamine synthase-like glycosyltransferase